MSVVDYQVSGLISYMMTSLVLHHVRTAGLPLSDRENNIGVGNRDEMSCY